MLPFNYKIKRSKRKTLCIAVYPGGEIVVKAPRRCSMKNIEQFLREKEQWVLTKQKEMSKIHPEQYKKQFVEGELFSFKGREYPLRIEKEPGRVYIHIEISNNAFVVRVDEHTTEQIRKAVERWYKKQASEYIISQCDYYEAIVNVKYTSVKIRTLKRKWGSCSNHQELTFNWKLIMADETIIDYVIIHELCHIVEFNHSSQFWSLVGEYMPDYVEKKQWLKERGHQLDI